MPVVCAVASLTLTLAWRGRAKVTEARITAEARIEHIEDTVLASGIIEPSKLVSVGAQASGRIVALHVALGDHVEKGALLAEIDPSTQKNALENAQAILDQDHAERVSRAAALKQAEFAFRRAQTTVAKEATSQADYELAEANFDGAKADVAALDAQIRQALIAVDTARVSLSYTKVIAPINGTVIAIVAPEGQTVNAVQAAPTIVKLADLSTMTVKAQISEADVTRVHAGQKVYFSILAAPEHRYEATLRAVEPAPQSMATDTSATPGAGAAGGAVSSAVYYDGLFDIANPDLALRPAMTAEVHIVLAEAAQALVIPTAALGEALPGRQRTVRVVAANGRVETRNVRVGINNRVEAQILSRLFSGERVIVSDANETAAAKP